MELAFTGVLFSTLANAIFIDIFEYLKGKKEIENFRALLYQIARNVIVDFYRQKKDKVVSLDEKMSEEKAFSFDPTQQIDKDLKFGKLLLALKELSETEREFITLRFINELSFKEISKITGEKEGTLRVNVHRAIEKLKKLVEKEENDDL